MDTSHTGKEHFSTFGYGDEGHSCHPSKIVRGVDELHADFKRFFEQFELQQLSEPEETVIAGEWAFDISKISSTLLPSGGGSSMRIDAKVFSWLRQQQDTRSQPGHSTNSPWN
jgi:hypothetical protein